MPSADQIGRGPLNPTKAVATYDAGQAGAAMQYTGNQIENTAYRVNVWVDDTARMHAQDALVQLKQREMDMTVGEEGYARLLNGDATKEGVLQKYQDKYKTHIQSLGAGLGKLARAKFERAAQQEKAEFEAGFMRHAIGEDLKHRGAVYKASIESSAQAVAQVYDNPTAVKRELTSIDQNVAQYVYRNGITDPALQQKFLRDARTTGHQAVIAGYIQNDQPELAEEYLGSVKDDMDQDAVQAVKNTLKPQIATQQGREIAEEMYAMHRSGKSASEIFTHKLKLTEGKSLEVMRVADHIYDDRIRALKQDQRQATGEVMLETIGLNVEESLKSPRLKELDAKDPVLAEKVRAQIMSIGRGEAGKKGNSTTYAGMQLYAELSDRIENATNAPTKTEIAGYFGVLPEKQINALMRRVDTVEGAATRAKIDPDLVNLGMPSSAKDTQKKMVYRGFVENKLDEWKAQNPGKVPTPEDKRNLITAASEEYVEVGKIWNSEVEAYRAKPGRSYPKSFGAMMQGYDDDDILAAYAHAQRVRQFAPPGRNYTDAELIKVWEQRKKTK